MNAEDAASRCAEILATVADLTGRLRACPDWRGECDPLVVRLGRIAGVDRTALWRNHRDGDGDLCTTIVAEWAAPGLEEWGNTLWGDCFPWEASGFGRWAAILGRGDPLVERASELPAGEREAALAHGAASVCEVPIQVAGEWWGQLCLSSADDGRLFLPCEVDALRIVATCFGAAVERMRELDRPAPVLPAPAPAALAALATVMLVEDEPLVLRLVERLLERGGYAVVSAATPRDARRLAAGMAAPDLLVTDVVLPGGSGLDLAAELRLSWPGLRVLYISGYPGDAFADRGPEPGDRLLRKPFRGTELLAAVERALS